MYIKRSVWNLNETLSPSECIHECIRNRINCQFPLELPFMHATQHFWLLTVPQPLKSLAPSPAPALMLPALLAPCFLNAFSSAPIRDSERQRIISPSGRA